MKMRLLISLNRLHTKGTEMVERQAHPTRHLLNGCHQLLNGELADLLSHCLVLTLQRKEDEPAGRC